MRKTMFRTAILIALLVPVYAQTIERVGGFDVVGGEILLKFNVPAATAISAAAQVADARPASHYRRTGGRGAERHNGRRLDGRFRGQLWRVVSSFFA